jgi:uncharacterized protein
VIRVTADSNIYISALHFGGSPDRFLELARSGVIHLTISDPILREVTRVLREKLGWSEAAGALAAARIADFTQRVRPAQKLDIIKDDPADNRILECAVEGRSQYLITGDNHLLRLKSFRSVRIIKLAEFLKIAPEPHS